MIIREDGEYDSASDFDEDTYALLATHEDDDTRPEQEEEHVTADDADKYMSLISHRVLSAQIVKAKKDQRHNLFHIKGVVKERSVRIIIDGGSCNNLASIDMVEKLSLPSRQHPQPYYIQWFNDGGKVKVTRMVRVPFSLGSYHDTIDCDIVPMQACSMLLGRPWQYDKQCLHDGRTNQYTLTHKGKKIILHPMSPEQILKDDLARASRNTNIECTKSENQKVVDELEQFNKMHKSDPSTSKEIKLKGASFLATRAEIFELDAHTDECYALICKEVLFSFEDMPSSLPPVVANLLQEYHDVFPKEVPPGLPPMRGIEHQIDLIPGASLPNRAPYRTNPEETKEIQ